MKKQTGSASVVIVIVLVVILFAVLGYVFWQNISKTDSAPQQNNSSSVQPETPSEDEVLVTVDEARYAFTVPEGFKAADQQLYTYTGSLKAEKSFINDKGDYFEILVPYGGGGGLSADYHWSYKVFEDGSLSVLKGEICNGDEIGCSSDNSSLEGIVSNNAGETQYYLAFGNRTKKTTDLSFVDDFTSKLRFK